MVNDGKYWRETKQGGKMVLFGLSGFVIEMFEFKNTSVECLELVLPISSR